MLSSILRAQNQDAVAQCQFSGLKKHGSRIKICVQRYVAYRFSVSRFTVRRVEFTVLKTLKYRFDLNSAIKTV